MDYAVQVVRDAEGLEQLADSWAALLDRAPSASIFASCAWNCAWWHYFGTGKRLYTLVVTDPAGRVRGIAPLMLRPLGSLRILEFIGTGLSDSGDFVLDPGCARPVLAAICAHLQSRRRDWDLADLDEMPSYSPLAGWLAQEPPPGLRLIQVPRTDCPFIPLPACWAEYTRALHRKPRYHLETFTRRFVEETGASFRLITDPADVPAAVARFYHLHLARWAVKPDTLNPAHLAPSFVPFLEDVCRQCAAHGWLRLAELCVGETVIASWISFQVNGRWNGYLTGFDPDWSAKRPGKILHGFVVRQALAEQAHELDFGRGAEDYKYELGAINRQNMRVVFANTTPRSALAFALAGLRIQGRDLVHRSGAARVMRAS